VLFERKVYFKIVYSKYMASRSCHYQWLMAKVIIKVNGSVMVVAILILIVNMGSNNGLKYELYYVIVNNASKRLSNIDLMNHWKLI
jgi:hypothetical protein